MRWESQNVDSDDAGRLPGMGATVVRRFDAPEALDMRFHEVRTKSALNHVPPGTSRVPFEWTINPYRGCTHACVYCFARPTHEYLELDAGRDFEREIIVKVNVPEVLRKELARPSWRGDAVALGTNTDPYQWVEGRYKLMRGIWEAMRDFRNPCSILTKSPLLLRDLDLLQEIAAVTDVSACLSVPTLDEKAWRATEPHTPNPQGAAGGGGRAQSRRHPDRRADRAADAGRQRRARAGRGDRRGGDRGAGDLHRRPDAASCAARSGRSTSSGCASTGRTSSRATSASTPTARTSRRPRSARSSWPRARRGRCGPIRYADATGGRGVHRWRRRGRPRVAQGSLF